MAVTAAPTVVLYFHAKRDIRQAVSMWLARVRNLVFSRLSSAIGDILIWPEENSANTTAANKLDAQRQPETSSQLTGESWRLAREAFYTSVIFEHRAQLLSRKLRLVTFAGLFVPLLVGGLALSYGAGFKALPTIIIVASALGLVQAAYSLWSIVSTWVESHAYAIESNIANKSIYNRAKALASDKSTDAELRQRRYELLEVEDTARRSQDYKQGISEKERRRAMRATLIQFGKECTRCKKVPSDMKDDGCGTCGNFSNWWTRRR